jgi:methylmalonyl-CoA mutase
LAEHEARTSWTAQHLAAAGLRAIRDEGEGSLPSVVEAFRSSGATAAVLTSADARHAEAGPALAQALRAAGAGVVWVAGRPGELRDAWLQAGVGGFLHLGQDGPATLGQLLDALGVSA